MLPAAHIPKYGVPPRFIVVVTLLLAAGLLGWAAIIWKTIKFVSTGVLP